MSEVKSALIGMVLMTLYACGGGDGGGPRERGLIFPGASRHPRKRRRQRAFRPAQRRKKLAASARSRLALGASGPGNPEYFFYPYEYSTPEARAIYDALSHRAANGDACFCVCAYGSTNGDCGVCSFP